MSGLGGRKARPQPLKTGRVEMREGERAPGLKRERILKRGGRKKPVRAYSSERRRRRKKRTRGEEEK